MLNSVRPARVACIMSRFPKVSETFVLYEVLAMEQLELSIELYPLRVCKVFGTKGLCDVGLSLPETVPRLIL